MKTIIGLILILSICKLAEAACGNFTTCDTCTPVDGCGWCAPTQTCLEGNSTSPFDSKCLGDSWEFGGCTPCAVFKDCRSCVARDTDCFWCASANSGMGGCKEIGYVGCPYTRKCPCDVYSDCSECVNDQDCRWCGLGQNCVRFNETCTGPQPVYNYTTQCACEAYRDCSSCNAEDGCNWCLSGECSESCTGPKVTNCQAYCNQIATTCDVCVAFKGCAWCGLTKQCVDAVTSPCPYQLSCPICAAASYCDTCLTIDGCVWCEDNKTCSPSNTNCLTAYACNSYCERYTDCDACSSSRGCGWCDDTNKCADVNEVTCFYTHTCNNNKEEKKCGFNGGAFVGGMFFVIGLGVLIVGGYLFYRWKTGRKFDYRELK